MCNKAEDSLVRELFNFLLACPLTTSLMFWQFATSGFVVSAVHCQRVYCTAITYCWDLFRLGGEVVFECCCSLHLDWSSHVFFFEFVTHG